MGFTHVEFLPITEHPFYRSWGYQTTGYFAPTSRYGSPQDFMFLVDHLHQQGIGVFLDWVPSHFPTDAHGLAFFDGTHLFEHADPRKGFHPEWKQRHLQLWPPRGAQFPAEQRLVLAGASITWTACGWMRSPPCSTWTTRASPANGFPTSTAATKTWRPSIFCAASTKRSIASIPDVQTIAEESTAWPQVSRPTYAGGLGFGLKWDMGWMHDTLRYMKRNASVRKYHHGELPFRMVYAFHENFVLPLSHDEVVHGKGSLFGMMAGRRMAAVSPTCGLLFGYMYGHARQKAACSWGANWRSGPSGTTNRALNGTCP